jgi:hypothetical protein
MTLCAKPVCQLGEKHALPLLSERAAEPRPDGCRPSADHEEMVGKMPREHWEGTQKKPLLLSFPQRSKKDKQRIFWFGDFAGTRISGRKPQTRFTFLICRDVLEEDFWPV